MIQIWPKSYRGILCRLFIFLEIQFELKIYVFISILVYYISEAVKAKFHKKTQQKTGKVFTEPTPYSEM